MTTIKVQCDIVSHTVAGYDVWFKPAEGDEHRPEHEPLFSCQPSGVIRLDHLRPEVAARFKPGKLYDLTITER